MSHLYHLEKDYLVADSMSRVFIGSATHVVDDNNELV